MRLCLMSMLIKEVNGHTRKTHSRRHRSFLLTKDWWFVESSLPESAEYITNMVWEASMPMPCSMFLERSGSRSVLVSNWRFCGITVESTEQTSWRNTQGARRFRLSLWTMFSTDQTWWASRSFGLKERDGIGNCWINWNLKTKNLITKQSFRWS